MLIQNGSFSRHILEKPRFIRKSFAERSASACNEQSIRGVAQLLKLVTHSLYSNPEIFLRELISNASDACDKLRFEALNNSALYKNDPDLKVRLSFDKTAKTLTIADNGIGLSRQEAIE